MFIYVSVWYNFISGVGFPSPGSNGLTATNASINKASEEAQVDRAGLGPGCAHAPSHKPPSPPARWFSVTPTTRSPPAHHSNPFFGGRLWPHSLPYTCRTTFLCDRFGRPRAPGNRSHPHRQPPLWGGSSVGTWGMFETHSRPNSTHTLRSVNPYWGTRRRITLREETYWIFH